MAKIIVVGAGIGGVPAAYELQAKLGRSHRALRLSVRASIFSLFRRIPGWPLARAGRDYGGAAAPPEKKDRLCCAAGRVDSCRGKPLI